MPQGTWQDGVLIPPDQDLIVLTKDVKYSAFQNIDPNDSEPETTLYGWTIPATFSQSNFDTALRSTLGSRVSGSLIIKHGGQKLIAVNFYDPVATVAELQQVETILNSHEAVEIDLGRRVYRSSDNKAVRVLFKVPNGVSTIVPTINYEASDALTVTNGEASMRIRPDDLSDDKLVVGVQTYDHEPKTLRIQQATDIADDPTKLPRPTLTKDQGVVVVSNPDTSVTTVRSNISSLDAQIKAHSGLDLTGVKPVMSWAVSSIVVLLKVVRWLVSRELRR